MRKTKVLIFITAILFLYILSIEAGMNSLKNNPASTSFSGIISNIFYNKIVYPVSKFPNSSSVTATSICINGREIVILPDKEQAKRAYEELVYYISSFSEGTLVSAEPESSISYRTKNHPKERVLSFEDAVKILKGIPSRSDFYTIKKGESIQDLSKKFGISEKAIRLLNTDLSFKEGEKVCISIPPPAINIILIKEKEYSESVPIEYRYQQDPSIKKDTRTISQVGSKGNFNIKSTSTYLNFTEIKEDIISKEEISSPVTQIIKLGTKQEIATGTFIRPVTGGEISSEYGLRDDDMHQGIDIALDFSSPIFASDSGIVKTSEFINGYGNTVILDHKNGFCTLYAHCEKLLVDSGQTVSQGEKIALVGSSGISTGPHLHFEILENGTHVNPLFYLSQ